MKNYAQVEIKTLTIMVNIIIRETIPPKLKAREQEKG